MIEIANQLVQSLFKKNSLQECSRWELEILADKYPYFGIAQLLVSGKLKQDNDADYEKQVQKTSLYFTNPLWLDYVLNNKPLPAEPRPSDTNTNAYVEVKPTAEEPPVEAVKEEPVGDTPKEETVALEPVIHVAAYETALTEETIANEVVEAGTSMDTRPEMEIVEQADPFGLPVSHEEEINSTIEKDETTILPVAVEIAEEPVPHEEIVKHEQPATVNGELNSETKEDIPVSVTGNDTKINDIRLSPLTQEEFNLNAPLIFEPYHTVDYFASQGIKLGQEEKPKDRFGQQLKSFTQWLKTIKNIPPAEMAKELGKGGDQKVINLAEHSLDDREIVTEAMAEVWAKQGKTEKAIDIYSKLSLQNPAKSAYFAGLIEQLKQH
jgi:hypothetical protein